MTRFRWKTIHVWSGVSSAHRRAGLPNALIAGFADGATGRYTDESSIVFSRITKDKGCERRIYLYMTIVINVLISAGWEFCLRSEAGYQLSWHILVCSLFAVSLSLCSVFSHIFYFGNLWAIGLANTRLFHQIRDHPPRLKKFKWTILPSTAPIMEINLLF